MQRSLALAGLIFLAALRPLAAQGPTEYGPMAGAVLANFHGKDSRTTGSRTGLLAGLFVRAHLGDALRIEPQLLYVQKGAKTDIDGGARSTLKLDMIQVPVLVKIVLPTAASTKVGPNFFIGPAMAFKLQCKIRTELPGSSTTQTCPSSDSTGSIRSTDFTFIFGFGLDVSRLAIQARYDIGFGPIVKGTANDQIHTDTWALSLGFRF